MKQSEILAALERNCHLRGSCFGCDMSGKGSLRNTCLLLELRNTLTQTQLPTTNHKLYETIHYERPDERHLRDLKRAFGE